MDSGACTPDATSVTCAARCGTVTNNCDESVICDPCPPGSTSQSVACLYHSATGVEHYASPTASSSGDGSIDNPWDLNTAFEQPGTLEAGDILWLRGGTYTGEFTSHLTGTSAAPIIVCPYQGERATLTSAGTTVDATLTPAGAYTWYWGIEITSATTDVDRSVPPCCASGNTSCLNNGYPVCDNGTPSWPSLRELPMGGSISCGNDLQNPNPEIKFINTIHHDATQGFAVWVGAPDMEITGNLVYHMGWDNPADRGHGHGMYTQNKTGARQSYDNIIFSGFANGIQTYGSASAVLDNMDFERNILFNVGVLSAVSGGDELQLGGGPPLNNLVVKQNYIYRNGDAGAFSVNYLWSEQASTGGHVTDNYFVANGRASYWNNLTFSNNTIIGKDTTIILLQRSGDSTAGFDWNNNSYFRSSAQYDPFTYDSDFDVDASNHPTYESMTFAQWQGLGLDTNSTLQDSGPTQNKIDVLPNPYEPGRAHIVVFNWENLNSVTVSLASTGLSLGQGYEVRDAQDFYGAPLLVGTYTGGDVSIPMTSTTVAQPVGTVPRPYVHSDLHFGAFIVLPTSL